MAALLGHNRDEQVALAVGGLLLEPLDELLAAGGFVGDHERHAEGQALVLEVGDDVLDRQPRGVVDAFDQIASHPAGVRDRVGRDDHLARTALADLVHRGQEGVGVADGAARLDALLGQQRDGEVDPHLCGLAHRLVVDHEARGGLALWHHETETHVTARRELAHSVEQLAAPERAVGHHQYLLHRAPSADVLSRGVLAANTSCSSLS